MENNPSAVTDTLERGMSLKFLTLVDISHGSYAVRLMYYVSYKYVVKVSYTAVFRL
jgi:hypothetical protein